MGLVDDMRAQLVAQQSAKMNLEIGPDGNPRFSPTLGPGGMPISGGGWTPQQWADWQNKIQDPTITPEQRQALYESQPQIQRYLQGPQANAPHAAAGSFYEYGSDPRLAQQLAGGAFLQSGVVGGRAAPQADFTASRDDLNAARAGLLAGAGRLGQAYEIGGQQQTLADQIAAASRGEGPSVAELAMRRASADEARRNMAMAAGVGGPGSVSALINAQNINALNQGRLQQDLGVQRAAEIATARGQLGDVLTGIRGQIGSEAGQYGGLAGQAAQIGGVRGQQALGQAGLQAGQNVLNQQGEQYYYGQGADWIKGQAQLKAQQATNWNNFHLGQQSQFNQAQQAGQARDDALLGAGLSAAGTVLATAAIPFTGGATAPIAAAGAANTANQASKASDARKKTGIRYAGPQVSQAYRAINDANADADYIYGAPVVYSSDIENKTRIAPASPATSAAYRGIARANRQADEMRGADVVYPSYGYEGPARANDQATQIRSARVEYPTPRSPFEPLSASAYEYKDPNAPGAGPGQHYGPMAQELEKTPAGRSVVTRMPDGSKGIDTGRLSLLNASATGELQRKVDRIEAGQALGAGPVETRSTVAKASGAAARQPATQRTPDIGALRSRNDRKEAMLKNIMSIGDRVSSALQRPVAYPEPWAPAMSQPVTAYQPTTQALQLPQPKYYGY